MIGLPTVPTAHTEPCNKMLVIYFHFFVQIIRSGVRAQEEEVLAEALFDMYKWKQNQSRHFVQLIKLH